MVKRKKETADFKQYLGIISIIGFAGVFVNSITGLNLDTWVNGLFFGIMGIALLISGGIKLFFQYFEDGLTGDEISKVITNLIGLASVLTGFSIIFHWDYPVLIGMRTIISLIAIIIIAADLYKEK